MNKFQKSTAGFSLIELMIAVAIIGILAAAAYPSYVRQIETGRRAECRSGLLRTMQQQERYFTQFNQYVAFATSSGATPVSSFSGDTPEKSACTITAAACGAQALNACIELTATPVKADSKIEKLFYDSQNLKQCQIAGARVTDTTTCWP